MADLDVTHRLDVNVRDEEAHAKLDRIITMLRTDAKRDYADKKRDLSMALDLSNLTASIAPLTDAVDNIQNVLNAQAALLADALASQGVGQDQIDAAVAAVQAQTNELVAATLSNLDPGTVPEEPVDPDSLPHPDNSLPGDQPVINPLDT